jgi:hypothetical protein
MVRRMVLLFAVLTVVVAPAAAGPDPTTVRIFHVRHCSVTEAAAAVEALLTENGSMTVQPRQSRITVQDRHDVVERAAQVIAELDRSPDRYLIDVRVLEGVQGKLPENQRAEVDERLLRMFPFTSYRTIGSARFDGMVGEPASAVLGEGYRVSFLAETLGIGADTPFGIPRPGTRVHLQWLTLERVADGADGSRRPSEVLRTSVFLSEKQEVVIGAGASEQSKRGLVLILQALSIGDD